MNNFSSRTLSKNELKKLEVEMEGLKELGYVA